MTTQDQAKPAGTAAAKPSPMNKPDIDNSLLGLHKQTIENLKAQNQALRLANDRLLEACKIASGAETMTLKLKRILLDAIAAAEQEQEH